MRPTRLVSALLLSATVLSCAAVEKDGELRLTVGAGPGIKREKISDSSLPGGAADPGNNGTADMDAKAGFYGELGPMWRLDSPTVGLVGGFGIFVADANGSTTRGGLEYKDRFFAYGGTVSIGASFQAGFVRLEALPFVDLGIGRAHVQLPTGRSDSGKAVYFAYGARFGAYLDGEQGSLGLQVGYMRFSSKVTFTATTTNDGYDDTISGAGPMAALVAGVAF